MEIVNLGIYLYVADNPIYFVNFLCICLWVFLLQRLTHILHVDPLL